MTDTESGVELFKKRMRIPFLVFVVLALLTLISAEVTNYLTDWASLGWKPMKGEITQIDTKKTVELKDPYFDVSAVYKYEIFGKEYKGNRLSFLKQGPLLGYDLGVFIRKYKVGDEIDIMVEPGEPQNSTIKTTPEHALFFNHCLAATMVFFLLYISTYPMIQPD